jgi:glycosyltransferase involved in cell wall biosynthesis
VIYVCIATRNNATTVGLVMWKLRKVFHDFPREYHILVADDASDDGTRETLETYRRALPLTLLRHDHQRGRAATLDSLFRDALERCDRPRRDCVATVPGDFSVSPAALPQLLKRFESGADVVIGEADPHGLSLGMRLVRRTAPWLLKPGIALPGVRDLLSGVAVIRLVTLKNCYQDRSSGLLETDGVCADAELVARTAAKARQVAAVDVADHPNGHSQANQPPAVRTAVSLFRAGRHLRIPGPETEVQRS